jgi:uncharacterized protein YqhQ
MMRAPNSMAVAVRKADGSILIRETPWEPVWSKVPLLRKPLFRGALMLVESLWNGIQALGFSAREAELDEASKEGREAGEEPEQLSKAALALTITASLLLAFGLFAVLPRMITWGLGHLVGNADLESGTELLFHAVNGIFKLAIFLAYLWAISKMQDIRRVFEYHGAEHKSVFAYERRDPLSVSDTQAFTTFHPRCGTSFLILVIAVSILIFSITFPLLPRMADNTVLNQLLLVLVELPLMFPVAGVAYELIRLSGKHPDHPLVRAVAAPGLWLQRITTQPPDDDQVEVALAAMIAALGREVGGEPIEGTERILRIRSLDELPLPEGLDAREIEPAAAACA